MDSKKEVRARVRLQLLASHLRVNQTSISREVRTYVENLFLHQNNQIPCNDDSFSFFLCNVGILRVHFLPNSFTIVVHLKDTSANIALPPLWLAIMKRPYKDCCCATPSSFA
jgi:hypothetical protein